MVYEIVIKKCIDHDSAMPIAEEIAAYTGLTQQNIVDLVMTKDFCIRRRADKNEVGELKRRFEQVDAFVEIKESDEEPARPK